MQRTEKKIRFRDREKLIMEEGEERVKKSKNNSGSRRKKCRMNKNGRRIENWKSD